MPGGIIQLLAWGSQNMKLNGNPSLTFFRKVIKSHTNFSMESIRFVTNRSLINVYENTIIKFKIPRAGDLIQQVYLVLELPDIAVNTYKFRWIRNFGEILIDNYTITLGGGLIERQYGEYMHIINTLSLGQDKRVIYDRMIGNVPELIEPERPTGDYPYITPVIPSRKLYIPLRTWFSKDSSSSLPLVCLQYSEVEFTVELRPLYHLYEVFENGIYRAPNINNPSERLHNFVSNINKTYMTSETTVDMNSFVEGNFYFVDKEEREYLTFNNHEYLIEQTFRIPRTNLKENNIFELILQNPVKEIIWVFKRNNLNLTNEWFKFDDNNNVKILKEAKIMFNGQDRIDLKDEMYFNCLQPWQHHKTCSKNGIYVYSFSLFPDEHDIVSGSCNMSRINKIEIMFNIIRPHLDAYAYDCNIYVTNYNFFKIASGLGGLVFSN